MNNFKSIAEFGKDEADKVVIRKGQFNPSSYIEEAGDIKEGLHYRTNFVNRLKAGEEYAPKAEFSVEVYIASMTSEIENDIETGRLIVRGLMPTYNGIEYLTLVVPKGEIANDIQSYYQLGMTENSLGIL